MQHIIHSYKSIPLGNLLWVQTNWHFICLPKTTFFWFIIHNWLAYCSTVVFVKTWELRPRHCQKLKVDFLETYIILYVLATKFMWQKWLIYIFLYFIFKNCDFCMSGSNLSYSMKRLYLCQKLPSLKFELQISLENMWHISASFIPHIAHFSTALSRHNSN